jgi:hypothetical protein
MPEPPREPAFDAQSLPEAPSLEWLRKQAKRRLNQLRKATPAARLADAQFDLAKPPDTDRSVMEMIRARGGARDLFTTLAIGEWDAAARLLSENPAQVQPAGASAGVLHLMAKRNNVRAVEWLLSHGLDPNARWSHWDAEVTPLHLAAAQGHADVVRLLLEAGADVHVRDSKHDADPIGWADFFRQPKIVEILKAHGAKT